MSSGNGQTISVCGNIFRLTETLGRGSYGTVHKAINLTSGAAVAVKLLSKDKIRRPHERQSIEKEIETMRVAVEQFENGHPHIVRLLCTKESQHHIFIVLEYCAGGDIATIMKQHNGLSEEQARLYLSQLACGLQFLRSQNVIHRDLKPANLLLSSKNAATAKLKIADFGFARELEKESMAESVVGSPLYMAPELLEYKSYDAKADLWSVGIILYEMLVNDHPFLLVDRVHATNHLALRRNIHRYFDKYGKIRLPKHISVSKECLDVLEGLLRVNPRERISFEDFFSAPFLILPNAENEVDAAQHAVSSLSLSSSSLKQPLVEDKKYDDWATFSDEYVMVDDFEDVGRRVLNENDVNVDIAETKHDQRKPTTQIVDIVAEVVKDTNIPVAQPSKEESYEEQPSNGIITYTEPAALKGDYISDDRMEEILGISYKSFESGSIGLFVPTPFGDYIAFHEGCPHYYLSMESIEASKKDGQNPRYVLGSIVFIEDYVVTTSDSNPFCLREGTKYHIVTVTPLGSSQSNAIASPSHANDQTLFMSQELLHQTHSSTPPSTSSLNSATSSLFSIFSSTANRIIAPPKQTPTQKLGMDAAENSKKQQHQRISFKNFHISDLGLFFLKGGKLPYVAFNEGAPNYYLSNESIEAAVNHDKIAHQSTVATQDKKQLPPYIIGEIIFIDSFQATEDYDPYRLPYGTRFHVVTVANPKHL